MIEQLRVSGRFAEPSEVVRRPDQPAADHLLPDAVGHHAGGERVGRRDEPFGQFPAAALRGAAAEAGLLFAREDHREPPRHDRAFVLELAPQVDRRVTDPFALAARHTAFANRHHLDARELLLAELPRLVLPCFDLGQFGRRELPAFVGLGLEQLLLLVFQLRGFGSQAGFSRRRRLGKLPLEVRELALQRDEPRRLRHLLHELLDFRVKRHRLPFELSIGRVLGRREEHRFHQIIAQPIVGDQLAAGDVAAEEDACQRIVILRGNRIELVIVATRAGQRQSQHLPTDQIDLAVDDLRDRQIASHLLPGGERQHACGDDAIESGSRSMRPVGRRVELGGGH